MSYSIIFETKFIKLKDGRLLHLDRSGCNNDNEGRKLDEFTGEIYTEERLKTKIEKIVTENNLYSLKIGNKWASYFDYGKHLLRMAKKALSYNDFNFGRCFVAKRYDGVKLYEPEERFMTPEEFSNECYNLMYENKQISYRRLFTVLNTEDEIINALDNKEIISFYVGKKYKK